jgi:hypothetical protein
MENLIKQRDSCLRIRKNGKLRKSELLLVWNIYKMSCRNLFESYGLRMKPSSKGFNFHRDNDGWNIILNNIGATLCLQKNWYNEWTPFAFLFDSVQHKMLYILKHPERL